MPKKDLNDFGGLLGDLWKELSPIVRAFLFLGLATGLAIGIGFLCSYPDDGGLRYVGLRLLFLFGGGLVLVSGTIGLLLGVGVETIIARFRAPKKRSPNRQSWRLSTRRVGGHQPPDPKRHGD